MNESKHTPGPWAIGGLDRRGFREIDSESADRSWYGFAEVAVMLDGAPSEEGLANARLIAAAPDMLAELQRLKTVLNQAGYSTAVTDEVIEKATGKEQS